MTILKKKTKSPFPGARIYTLFAPLFRSRTTLAKQLERLFFFLSRYGGGCRECNKGIFVRRSHGVMVSTLDFESSDPSSNLGGT
ncbi:hypothetical protein DMN91_004008 [Ooceraea biroi]|uniref:Uncharacterized protein n=1 Tax=Ooceraea biroi TaxID=2015173 RepID=A0A3L8DTM7_OOCBI|nr:hypothetical protein DMN91_004008 [Ooceraea biroi]